MTNKFVGSSLESGQLFRRSRNSVALKTLKFINKFTKAYCWILHRARFIKITSSLPSCLRSISILHTDIFHWGFQIKIISSNLVYRWNTYEESRNKISEEFYSYSRLHETTNNIKRNTYITPDTALNACIENIPVEIKIQNIGDNTINQDVSTELPKL